MIVAVCIAILFEREITRIDFPARFAAFQLWLIERQWKRELRKKSRSQRSANA